MSDKKEKNTNKKTSSNTHIFEVHTMERDNELKKTQPQENISQQKTAELSKMQKKTAPFGGKKKKEELKAANPFLAEESAESAKKAQKPQKGLELERSPKPKKSTFAPQKNDDIIEKINQTPADIAPKEAPVPTEVKNPKRTLYIVMIVFIAIFILSVGGFTVYYFVFDGGDESAVKDIEVQVQEPVSTTTAEDNVSAELVKQMYSADLPNHFSFDVESPTAASDIAGELEKIEQNMSMESITGPISFIVTDANNNPVSFHVFVMSANMSVPQNVLTSLEESFEIYAYNDPKYGVRFGFAIDARDVNLLQEALSAEESQLPQALTFVLGDDAQVDPAAVAFNDSAYNTYTIRYANLIADESYSVDYTVNNLRLLIGTTKNTLRAIIESARGGVYEAENDSAAMFQIDPAFIDILEKCAPYTGVYEHPFLEFEAKRTIIGLSGGVCDYEETMPGDTLLKCAYSDESRRKLVDYYRKLNDASSYKQNARAPIGGDVESEVLLDEKQVQDPTTEIINKECEVVM